MLANEAGLPYAALALVTDYDSWREDTEAVSFFIIKPHRPHNYIDARNGGNIFLSRVSFLR